MKNLSEIVILDDRKYTDEHIWAKKDGNTYLLGISDFAQDQLGEIVYIEMPNAEDAFTANADFGTVESVKSVNKLFMPFDGVIIAYNEELEEKVTMINGDCYEKAWIVRVKANNDADFDNMLTAEAYRKILEK